MPTFYGPTGTAIVSRAETAVLSGTATKTATPTVYVSGTATVDRTSLAAWSAQIRRTATRVLLGAEAEDVLRVSGDVSVAADLDSPVATASFVVTDPRAAFFSADSIATGGIPVRIRCRISTDLASADTLVFQGATEAAPNEGAYVPVATIQAASDGADFLEEKGCLALAAFAGYTRLDALKGFAESVGIDPDRIIGGEDWAVIRLPLDLSGLSTWELTRRFAELEDCYVRIVDGNLEIIPARQIIGPAAAPVFDFTQANYLSVSETPPNRPVTRYVLSAVGIPEELFVGATEETAAEIAGGTDSLGVRWETRTLTTTINGVRIRQRIEEWRDVAIPGVTPSATAWRLWRLTETETEWGTVLVDGVSLKTSRLDLESTTVSEYFSPPCRTADGYVWSDGTRHVADTASWQITGTTWTAYTYDPDSCILASKVTRTGGWYSELLSGGEVYDGGAERADAAYQWIAADAIPPLGMVVETYAEETSDAEHAVTSETVTTGWAGTPSETWRDKSGSLTRWSTVPGSGVVTQATAEFFEDGSTAYNAKPYAGALPVLQRASGDIPQYRTTPLVLTATADGSRYTASPHVETVWGAETMDDLVRVSRHRFREQHSPRITVLHRAIPQLRLCHCLSATDPTRSLDGRPGIVTGYRLILDASTTGALNQETTVMLPLAEYDPPAEAA